MIGLVRMLYTRVFVSRHIIRINSERGGTMTTKHKANEMGEVLQLGQPQRIQTASVQIQQHKIRLNGDITEPESFTDELNVIENLGENDSATIVINTNGGHLDTAVEFCSAIIGTEGYVHGHINGCAHSAGSMIFLKCHSYSISPYATMLIHSPSGGFVGKFGDLFAQAEHFKDWTNFFYKDVYEDFLTEEELEKVIDGKDMWLNASQIEERLERMVQIRSVRMEQEAEEQAEAFIDAELDGCDKFDAEGSEDTSGHEYQLGSDLNKQRVGCEDCDCKSKQKFKVGDHVRVISNACGGEDPIGSEDIIVNNDDGCHQLKSGWWYETEELELVE
jgi:ATP-dependent protease ClpP protease subunit